VRFEKCWLTAWGVTLLRYVERGVAVVLVRVYPPFARSWDDAAHKRGERRRVGWREEGLGGEEGS
jgi:hypothetical protein